MRTTLTIDDEVMAELRRRSRAVHGGLKEVVNEVLRRGLSVEPGPLPPQAPFEVRAKACGFLPGVDVLKLNQLADQLEADDFVTQHRGRGVAS
jgi:hypothetical protein